MVLCQLCERDVEDITKHHLIPKQKFNKKWRRIYKKSGLKHWEVTISVCVPCSKQVHTLFTNKELAENYNTLDKLKEDYNIQKWVDWVRRHNPGSSKYVYW
mgnify:CR=1 FL=1